MQLTVTGKQVDVGDALRRHVETTLEALLGKYFRTAIEAHAVFAREAHLIAVDLSLHVGRGIVVNSRGSATDHYLAFDTAAERLAKQIAPLQAPAARLSRQGAPGRRAAGNGAVLRAGADRRCPRRRCR